MTYAYSLPTQLCVNGKMYNIRTDFRAVLDILIAMSDPELEAWEKQEVMIQILYIDADSITASDYAEACKQATEFIDCGNTEKQEKSSVRILDWEQDASIIIPAVNKVAGKEVRAVEHLHWWTFLGYFMEIEEGLLSQVLAIRQKKAKHKKLEKWEKEFEKNNPDLINIKKVISKEQQEEINNLEKWL